MRESLFWRVAFGVGFIIIGLGGLAESLWALTLVAVGVAIIVFNVWQENRAKEAKQSSVDKDLAEWQRITTHGQLEPTHAQVEGDLPGIRSLGAHLAVEHGQKARVDRIINFTTRERRPDFVTYGGLAQEHFELHKQGA